MVPDAFAKWHFMGYESDRVMLNQLLEMILFLPFYF
jgi:hypothetical protein